MDSAVAEKQMDAAPAVKAQLADQVGSARRREILTVLVTAGLAFLFFVPHLFLSMSFVDDDIRLFYWPTYVSLARALREGQFPLWWPNLFGGFPVYALGSLGMFYLPTLVILLLAPTPHTVTIVLAVRAMLAAGFTYAFARVLGVSRAGAVVAGVVFAFSGFSVAHMQHVDLNNSAVWLPVILLGVELAARHTGGPRWAWIGLAGLAYGMAWLGVHFNIPLVIFVGVGFYAAGRMLFNGSEPTAEGAKTAKKNSFEPLHSLRSLGLVWLRGTPHDLLLLLTSLTAIAVIGLGIGAVQSLPALELLGLSDRAEGLNWTRATEYSLPPYNLILLLFPHFFREGGVDWTLWSRWETTVYLGVLPLLLALVAIFFVRRRDVTLLAGLALLGLLLAFGRYTPLYGLLYALPGFHSMRAPGRFALHFHFGLAVLAGYGITWLQAGVPGAQWPRLAAWLRRAGVVTGLLVPGIWLAQQFVTAQPRLVDSAIWRFYLRQASSGQAAPPEVVYTGLLHALNLRSPGVFVPLLMIVASLALLGFWARRPGLRLWPVLALALILVDLFPFAWNFYTTAPLGRLIDPSPAVGFLNDRAGDGRVYTWKRTPVEPNQLLPWPIQEANGYDPLELQRHAEFAAQVEFGESRLLDAWNVRYVVPRRDPPGASIGSVIFDPTRPIATVSPGHPEVTFSVVPQPASELRLVTALAHAPEVPQAATVAEIAVTNLDGTLQRFPVRAGIETAEWALRRPDVTTQARHQAARVAYARRSQEGPGGPFVGQFYLAAFAWDIGAAAPISQVTVRYLYPAGELRTFGIAYRDGLTRRTTQVGRFQNTRYRLAFSDERTAIYENLTALPRAYLVPTARLMRLPEPILAYMSSWAFDPRREAILEEPFDPRQLSPGIAFDDLGTVRIENEAGEQLALQIDASYDALLILTDTYFPGWQAMSDGQPVHIYRANYLFRGVFVPAGQHRVVFRFEPQPLRVGAVISVVSLASTLGLMMGGWLLSRSRY